MKTMTICSKKYMYLSASSEYDENSKTTVYGVPTNQAIQNALEVEVRLLDQIEDITEILLEQIEGVNGWPGLTREEARTMAKNILWVDIPVRLEMHVKANTP